MKIFHTADWHLGKLVQGVYMTDDQRYILEQFLQAIDEEQPDVVILAGDLYDRSLPPVEAVNLLDEISEEIVLKRNVPVLAIAGNHDSPTRLQFGNKLMKNAGFYIVGDVDPHLEPVILQDEFGDVCFYLVPFAEPSTIKHLFGDESISTFDDAMKKITSTIVEKMDKTKRHVFIGHAFVTPNGVQSENTSDSERPLAIGGTECVNSDYFLPFHYTALGHLHRAHFVTEEKIRYAGSPLKYSASEANHEKGFYIVNLDEKGQVEIEKRKLIPKRDLRIVEGTMQEILRHSISEDYVFVRLLDSTPVVGAMEQIRTVYPNALHVERKTFHSTNESIDKMKLRERQDDLSLFKAFYKEILNEEASEETIQLFQEVLQEMLQKERETIKEVIHQ